MICMAYLYIVPLDLKNVKKVQVYRLISSLQTYHPTLQFTPWSLDLFIRVPFQLHGTLLQPFLRIELIVHIAISVLPESSEAVEGGVSCPRTQHINNVPRLRGKKNDISLKIMHQAGFETARQAATSAERHALTIAPSPSLPKGVSATF